MPVLQIQNDFPVKPRPFVILVSYMLLIISFYMFYSRTFNYIQSVKQNDFFQTVVFNYPEQNNRKNSQYKISGYLVIPKYISDFESSPLSVFIKNNGDSVITGTLSVEFKVKTPGENETFEKNCREIDVNKEIPVVEVELSNRRSRTNVVLIEIPPNRGREVTFFIRLVPTQEPTTEGICFNLVFNDTEMQKLTSFSYPRFNRSEMIRYWFITRVLVPPGVNFVLVALVLLFVGVGQIIAEYIVIPWLKKSLIHLIKELLLIIKELLLIIKERGLIYLIKKLLLIIKELLLKKLGVSSWSLLLIFFLHLWLLYIVIKNALLHYIFALFIYALSGIAASIVDEKLSPKKQKN